MAATESDERIEAKAFLNGNEFVLLSAVKVPLADIAGLIPETVQGKSLRPLLEGTGDSGRSAIHYEILMEKEGPESFPVPERGIRTRDWLYVRTRESPKVLFDVQNDPLEMNNLAGSSEHADILASLDQQIEKHMADTGDSWDIEALFPPPDFQTHEDGDTYLKTLLDGAITAP